MGEQLPHVRFVHRGEEVTGPGPLPESYAVRASITRNVDGWTSVHHLPTFYLDSNVQGLVSEAHAAEVARSLLDPFGQYGSPEAGASDAGLLDIYAVGLWCAALVSCCCWCSRV